MHFWYSRRYIRASSILVTDTIELRRSDQVNTDDLHKEWIRECGVYDGHGAQENGQKKSTWIEPYALINLEAAKTQ